MNSISSNDSNGVGLEVNPDEIARRAYEIWQSEGSPEGCDQQHWFRAEQELAGRGPTTGRGTETAERATGEVDVYPPTVDLSQPDSSRASSTGGTNRRRESASPFSARKSSKGSKR